jgi:hypothetical protein
MKLYNLNEYEYVENKDTKVSTRVIKTVMKDLPFDEAKKIRRKMVGSFISPTTKVS